MLFKTVPSTVLALAATVAAQGSTPIEANSTTPCSRVTSDQSVYFGNNPNATIYVTTAQAAWDCIKGIQLNVNDTTQLLDWLVPYLGFQSTLTYLKDPPPSYERPPVDILGGIQDLKNEVINGTFTNQYDFDVALKRLMTTGRDFHFDIQVGVLGLFQFTLSHSLVSVSSDGAALPKIYVYEDILNTGSGPNGSQQGYTPSAVKTLGGQDVTDYLKAWMSSNSFYGMIEQHADWNNIFPNSAYTWTSSVSRGFSFTAFYNGNSLNGTYENGTQFEWTYSSWTRTSFGASSIHDEQSLYDNWVLKASTSATPTNSSATTSINVPAPTIDPESPEFDPDGSAATTTLGSDQAPGSPTDSPPSIMSFVSSSTGTAVAGLARKAARLERSQEQLFKFPEMYKKPKADDVLPSGIKSVPGPYPTNPVTTQAHLGFGGVVTGYNLIDQSLAVLSLPSFEAKQGLAEYTVNTTDYADAVQDFIQKSKAAGMQKVVIDLQANGGGSVVLGYETFKHFFPDITPFGGSRLRATKELNVLGSSYTSAVNGSIQLPEGAKLSIGTPFSSIHTEDANGVAYTAWEPFFGPIQDHGDNFTNTMRYNLSDTVFTEAIGDIIIYGYGSRQNNDPRPWDAKDIILLTDGFCGSTCAIFSEFMKTEAGVRSVVMGGLPEAGPMQAGSGTRGSQTFAYTDIDNTATSIRNVETYLLNISASPDLPPSYSDVRYSVRSGSINLRDQVRPDSEVPLQFIYEAADCRLFYTPPMLTDYTVLWTTAANAIWKNNSLCVSGSTGNPTSGNETSLDAPPTGTGSAPSSTSSSGPASGLNDKGGLVAMGAAAIMAGLVLA